MKIVISINGRFHFFDLIKTLSRKNIISCIFTTYPKLITDRWDFPNINIKRFLLLELFKRLSGYLKLSKRIEFIQKYLFGYYVKNNLPKDFDILIFFAGNGWHSPIVKSDRKLISIVDEGSSHIKFHQKILKEEYSLCNCKNRPHFNDKIINQTLLEYKHSDRIVVPSNFVKQTFINEGTSENKLFVNPYGVDTSNFKQISKSDRVFRIITSGGATIQKGFHYLLEAFYKLRIKNLELWHLGKVHPEIFPYIKKFTRKGLILKGHIPQNDLFKYYSQGNIFVLMSIQDGFGMVLVQAMSCGLPIITTTNSGGPDLITRNGKEGFIINIRDVDGLIEKITYIYENNLSYDMGQSAKLRVSQGYTWNDYGNRYFNFLQKIHNDEPIK